MTDTDDAIRRETEEALKRAQEAVRAERAAKQKGSGQAASIDNDNSEPNEIDRLARLPTIEIDRQREDAAKRLGVRVGTIDKMVRKKAGPSQGRGREPAALEG